MRSKLTKYLSLLLLLVIMAVATAACSTVEPVDQNRQDAVTSREQLFDRAEAKYPAPTNLVNFPIRAALVEYTQRQDRVNQPWYIYIMGMDGTYVGYFVGQTYPINSCNFLSSTERIVDSGTTELIVTSPSYDGIFYGGGGASSNCNAYFFFDVTTNALQTFVAPMWFASDSPLDLDIPRLNSTEQVNDVPGGTP